MRATPLYFNNEQRSIVDRAIRDHATYRNWQIIALNVRTNHVHVVVRTTPQTPEQVMSQFKSWATRRLREATLVEATDRVWTKHGSTRYLWDEPAVQDAAEYVRNQ